jgi:DNA modification methylase
MARAKLTTQLDRSAELRAAMVAKFGFVPLSVLSIGRGELSRRLYQFQGEARPDRPRMTYKDIEAGVTRSTPASAEGQNRKVMSIMPAELVEFFVKYYARRGDTYLDPFMGQGVQMQVAKVLGLHYHGYDLSSEFFAYIASVRDKIDDGKTTISITLGDSREPSNVPDGAGDFSFTSPPYWDIEYYGDDPRQLGTDKTYDEFLDGMEDVARAWLPKFRTGAYFVVNVNDFRRDRRFYPYHADLISRFEAAGWALTDLWIIQGLVGGMPRAFAVSFNVKRHAPKVHEYAIVFRKPAAAPASSR